MDRVCSCSGTLKCEVALAAQAAACWHRPQGLLAKGPALGRLIRLMCSSSADPATVAACVGALNNVCAMEEASDCVCEEARHATPQASAFGPSIVPGWLAVSHSGSQHSSFKAAMGLLIQFFGQDHHMSATS